MPNHVAAGTVGTAYASSDDDQTTTNDDQTTEPRTFDLFQLQSQDPTETFTDLTKRQIAKSYGFSTVPMFQWVQKIKVGESTYDERDDVDTKMMKRYEDFINKYGQPSEFPSPEEILAQASGVAGQAFGVPLGAAIGASIAPAFSDAVSITGSDVFKAAVPGNLAGKGALSFGTDTYFDPSTGKAVAEGTAGAQQGANIMFNKDVTGMEIFTDPGQIGQTAGAAVGSFAVQLAMGEDPASAARKAGAGAIARHVAQSIFTPIFGGPIGAIAGFIGGALGGRVICNELHKQGLLTKEQVLMDYKFTRDYLTPTHVNGYHLWAVWVVKQMRKGRMVKFWKHIATHRANEIAYIYGKREKPDYLGKIYRRIGEPVCWLLGTFTEKTDWTVLYKEKNNG